MARAPVLLAGLSFVACSDSAGPGAPLPGPGDAAPPAFDAAVDAGHGAAGDDGGRDANVDPAPDSGLPPGDAAQPTGCVAATRGAPADDPYRRVRTTEDLPDDVPGAYQVHVLYVEPSDGIAPARLDEDGSIRRSAAAFSAWLRARTGGSTLRLDTCGGVLDVTHVRLPEPFTERAMAQGDTLAPLGTVYLRDRLEAELKKTFDAPNKLYLVYYDGLAFGHCGGAPYPPSLLGRFPGLFLGGLFSASYLTVEAPEGATSLTVFDPGQAGLLAGSYAARLDGEAVEVANVSGTTVTLAAPLAAAHGKGAILLADQRPPDCRDNPLSSDGVSLGYMDYSAAHELLHALGIVGSGAPYFSTVAAPGHLTEESGGGTADLMYQGALPWDCSGPIHPSPEASPCVLDPAHQNYFGLSDGAAGVDLARSAFLEPLPEGAELPAGFP